MKITSRVAVALLMIVTLASCESILLSLAPIIGIWETTVLEETRQKEIAIDGTMTDSSGALVAHGTWSLVDDLLTMKFSDGTSTKAFVEFCSCKNKMTLTPEGGGVPTVYKRK